MKTNLSVVVPCYNEEKSIGKIVERFSLSKPAKRGFELVLVDNGSSDSTGALIESAVRKNRFVRRVKVRKNIGYGFGIFSGLKACRGKFVCWTHADLQADPLDAARAHEIALSQPAPEKCFVKGRRQNRPLLDSFLAFGMSVFAALALGRWLSDINAQPNLFHRSFLKALKDPPRDFSFDLFALYMAGKAGMKIVRFPVDFSKRLHGQSHWNTGIFGKWKFIKRTVLFILELRKRLKE